MITSKPPRPSIKVVKQTIRQLVDEYAEKSINWNEEKLCLAIHSNIQFRFLKTCLYHPMWHNYMRWKAYDAIRLKQKESELFD